MTAQSPQYSPWIPATLDLPTNNLDDIKAHVRRAMDSVNRQAANSPANAPLLSGLTEPSPNMRIEDYVRQAIALHAPETLIGDNRPSLLADSRAQVSAVNAPYAQKAVPDTDWLLPTTHPGLPYDPRGPGVQICCRPADAMGGYVDHCWLKTDRKEAGMGGNPNIAPGMQSEGYGTPVWINDHSKDTPTHCTTLKNVDEACVNRQLETGKPLGQWIPPFNHCQSFAYGIANSCRTGPQE